MSPAEKQFTERQKEALDISRSMCVTASAGTGKTTLLAERYVQSLLSEENLLPENILCLTYTDKAAVEMRDRIEANLRAKYQKENTEHLKKAIDTFYRSNISTFHGFCAKLLREFSLEAKVTPGFSIMDEVAAAELVDTAIDDFMEAPPEKLYNDVVYLFTCISKYTVKETVKLILAKWRIIESWYLRFAADPKGVYEELAVKFRERMDKYAQELLADEDIAKFFDLSLHFKYRGNSRVLAAGDNYRKLKNADTFDVRCDALQKLQGYILEQKSIDAADKKDPDLWDRDFLLQASSRYNEIVSKIVAAPVLPYEDGQTQFLIKAMLSYGAVAQELYERIEDKKKRSGMLDFNDLIERSRYLMTRKPVVQQLRERFRFILVDEVQDNDPTLTEIIKTLRGDNERDNRIFIVGDLKQSIYKFRGADPEGAREYFNSFSSTVDLDTCFRSLAPIINTVNTVFKPIFDGRKPGLSYNGVQGIRDGTHGKVRIIHQERKQKKVFPADVQMQSEQLAGWIQHVVESNELRIGNDPYTRPATYGDIVILQDRGTDLPSLTKELDNYGVPYRIVKGKEFYASEEVRDFLHLLKTVVYPEDDIALYGVLASPYFGISPALLSLYPAKSRWDRSTLLERLSESSNPEIAAALEKLSRFRTYQSSMSLIGLCRRMVQETGVRSVYATMNSGSGRISNLDTILDFVSGFSDTAFACIDRIEKNIEAEAADEIGDDEIAEEDADFVRIMTIHASKGLEFPVVILSYAGRYMYTRYDSVMVNPEYGLGLSLKRNKDDKDPIPFYSYLAMKHELKLALEEERKRLFYVALTRAQDHLVLAESSFQDAYTDNAFMKYYRKSVPVKSDTVIQKILGEPKDTSYDVYVPQEWDAVAPVAVPKEEDTERMRMGTCIHEILEGNDPEETCCRYGFPDCIEEFTKYLDNFLHSELMTTDIAESNCELKAINDLKENKRIDRLVRKTDGTYFIVDYKLSKPKEESDLEKYRNQVAGYARIIQDVTGQKNVPGWLYFIEEDEFVQVC